MFIFVVKPLGTCRGWGSSPSVALLSAPRRLSVRHREVLIRWHGAGAEGGEGTGPHLERFGQKGARHSEPDQGLTLLEMKMERKKEIMMEVVSACSVHIEALAKKEAILQDLACSSSRLMDKKSLEREALFHSRSIKDSRRLHDGDTQGLFRAEVALGYAEVSALLCLSLQFTDSHKGYRQGGAEEEEGEERVERGGICGRSRPKGSVSQHVSHGHSLALAMADFVAAVVQRVLTPEAGPSMPSSPTVPTGIDCWSSAITASHSGPRCSPSHPRSLTLTRPHPFTVDPSPGPVAKATGISFLKFFGRSTPELDDGYLASSVTHTPPTPSIMFGGKLCNHQLKRGGEEMKGAGNTGALIYAACANMDETSVVTSHAFAVSCPVQAHGAGLVVQGLPGPGSSANISPPFLSQLPSFSYLPPFFPSSIPPPPS
ncbi:unnamed protein product, partial [Pleuronectes platessa]